MAQLNEDLLLGGMAISNPYIKGAAVAVLALVLAVGVLAASTLQMVLGYLYILPFTIYLTGTNIMNAGIVLVLFFSYVLFKKSERLVVDATAVYIFVFIMSFVPSLFIASSKVLVTHLSMLFQYICCLLMYVFVSNAIDTEEHISSITKGLMAVLYLYSFFAIVEYFFFPYSVGLHRVRGPWREYEIYSEYLSYMLPLAVYRFRDSKLKLICTCCFILVMMLLTGTRGGPVSLLLGLMLWWMLESNRLANAVKATALAVVLLPLALISYEFISSGTKIDKADALVQRLSDTTLNKNFIPDTRASVWTIHGKLISKVGLLGEGPNPRGNWYYKAIAAGDATLLAGSRLPDPSVAGYPHSLPLTLMETGGVPALFAFYAMAVSILVRLYRLKRRVADSPVHEHMTRLLNVLIISIAIFLINETKIEFVRYFHYQLYIFGYLFGLAGGVIRCYTKILDSDGAAA
ncbi:MAG TPA: hypothetical protein VN419_10910 [Humidesulfovibrio sp.]|uniref:hypothetical protein n=1 Tax=Humidesulfovibrio sp. TaxID=2910988 RepID=UPI002B79E55B|nr:hypothetical protein [Humidesulfovibrio sp.]HWR04517.1 hypothetical protein [Humidesulfovibrio sp.]